MYYYVVCTSLIVAIPCLSGAVELYERYSEPPVILSPLGIVTPTGQDMDLYNKSGVTVGIGREIILKYNSNLDMTATLSRFNLNLVGSLGPGMVLLKTSDRQLTIAVINQLVKLEGVDYAHPDYRREVETR